MDTSSSAPRLCYSFQHYQQWSSSGSDSDLSYMSSPETLSPVPSMDSSLSPSSSASFSYLQHQSTESTPKAAVKTVGYSDRDLLESTSSTGPGKRKMARTPRGPRVTRIRSKQRESASEKEKLRMRDLTKALNHLRTYLPPSVAPAGQTLTKIETLRLAIRYISDLSEQLGLSDEVLEQWRSRREEEKGDDCCSSSEISSPDILNSSGGSYFQCGSAAVGCAWTQSQSFGLGLNTSQYHHHQQSQPVSSGSCGLGAGLCSTVQYSGQYSQETQGDVYVSNMENGDLLLPPATQPMSCQMYGKDFCSPLAPREYWG